jgi:hypothetical protein
LHDSGTARWSSESTWFGRAQRMSLYSVSACISASRVRALDDGSSKVRKLQARKSLETKMESQPKNKHGVGKLVPPLTGVGSHAIAAQASAREYESQPRTHKVFGGGRQVLTTYCDCVKKYRTLCSMQHAITSSQEWSHCVLARLISRLAGLGEQPENWDSSTESVACCPPNAAVRRSRGSMDPPGCSSVCLRW